MDETTIFKNGSYRYIRGPFQYSGGVAAEPGFIIKRARFMQAISIKHGFEAIEAYLTGLGRPLASFCACELRSPEPFDDAGFITFNRAYVNTLEKWGIFKNDDNPVAVQTFVRWSIHPRSQGFTPFPIQFPMTKVH